MGKGMKGGLGGETYVYKQPVSKSQTGTLSNSMRGPLITSHPSVWEGKSRPDERGHLFNPMSMCV